MLTKQDIQCLIDECRRTGEQGLKNGTNAIIQEIHVDFLSPPNDFLGIRNNPAIFVNQDTYNLLGKYHPNWVVNQIIAVKKDFLDNEVINVIGIIVHETGHAFNVAAKIINSEVNAYIFEIETLTIWFKNRNPMLFNCSRQEVQAYFESRLPFYQNGIKTNSYLASLVKRIEENNALDETDASCDSLSKKKASRFAVQTRREDPRTSTFFNSNPLLDAPSTLSEENSTHMH